MDEFLAPIFTLIENNPPLEIITTEPQNGRYPGVAEPIKGIQHIEKPDIAIQSFTQENDLIVVTGSLYLCGNILSYLGLNADIL
jgi:folylpolyglutamate synthase/dihydropteroate synthase